jgi:hypothetical protein
LWGRFRGNRVFRRVEIFSNIVFENTTKSFSTEEFMHRMSMIIEFRYKIFKDFDTVDASEFQGFG